MPDYEIPSAVAEVEGTEFLDKPDYNRVFVGGMSAGVFGPITRAGTAGDLIAPQVMHALITDIGSAAWLNLPTRAARRGCRSPCRCCPKRV